MFEIGKVGLAVAAALALVAGWSAAGLGPARAGIPVLPAYFNPDDAEPPLMFMRQAPPPTSDSENKGTYAYGPLTDSIAQNIDDQNRSKWSGHNWASIWANRAWVPRGQVPITPNPFYPAIRDSKGNPYGTEFTTYARANAATKAEALYIMGASASVWQAPLKAAGVSWIAWNTLNADPDAYFTRVSQDGSTKVILDKMIIPTTVAASAYGMRVDYEVQDSRNSNYAWPFLDDLGATIRSYGLKAYLYTNPWDSASTQKNGFSFSKIDDIKANFDYISILVWGGANQCSMETSYPYGVHFLKGVSGVLDFKQVLLTVDLLNCSESEAILMYLQRAIDHFSGYVIWDDGAVDGGSKLTGSNLVIYALLHGV
ncbi:MAG: hypothetical protein ACR2F8_03405 [Caulobacteraceae bacterium]